MGWHTRWWWRKLIAQPFEYGDGLYKHACACQQHLGLWVHGHQQVDQFMCV
jgi:hypothetical protein